MAKDKRKLADFKTPPKSALPNLNRAQRRQAAALARKRARDRAREERQ